MEPAADLIKSRGNFVSVSGQRAIVRVGLVTPIRQQTAVFGIHDEQETIEKDQAVLLAGAQVLLRIERVVVVDEETLDAKPESFEYTVPEFFADANRVFGAAVYGSLDQRLAVVG